MWHDLTIFKKGLVLISVPLLFQLAFVGLLADMQRSNADAVRWSIHSKEVLQQTQVVWRSLLELGTGLRGFVLAADPQLRTADEQAAKQLPKDELRNPLAPVRNAVQILNRPDVGPDMARAAREILERQVQHLTRLVDDLLDVSRIMRGKIELRKRPVDLATVFARAAETAQPTLDTRGQELVRA